MFPLVGEHSCVFRMVYSPKRTTCLRRSLRSHVSSPIHAAIAGGLGILFGLACIGALMEPPGGQVSLAAGTSSGSMAVVAHARLQAAEYPQPVNASHRNLQLPRAPRHRGERPTSGIEEVEGITSATILAMLGTECHQPFVIVAVQCCPLAGHPLSLLRPPSLLAG